jgi:hypothetical protein
MSIRLRYWLDAMRELDAVKAARRPQESPAGAMHGAAKVEYLHA